MQSGNMDNAPMAHFAASQTMYCLAFSRKLGFFTTLAIPAGLLAYRADDSMRQYEDIRYCAYI